MSYNSFTYYGKVIRVCETKSGVSAKTGNKWYSQDFMMEELDVQRPGRILLNVFGEEKIKALNIIEGQILTVSYSPSVSEFGDSLYGKNEAWKAVADPNQPQPAGTIVIRQEVIGSPQQPTSQQPVPQYAPQQPTPQYAPQQPAPQQSISQPVPQPAPQPTYPQPAPQQPTTQPASFYPPQDFPPEPSTDGLPF